MVELSNKWHLYGHFFIILTHILFCRELEMSEYLGIKMPVINTTS